VNLLVLAGIVAAFVVLRLLKVGLAVWIAAWWLALYVICELGFSTPIPQSVITMYMAIGTIALISYCMSSRERARAAVRPIVRLATERKLTPLLGIVLILIPAGAAFSVYRSMNVPVEAPFFARTVHPSPPASITVHEQEIDVASGDNPLRHLQESDPEAFAAHVASGRDLYYENCFYCHGDGLAADGVFAHGLNPIPTNFTDPNVLPNFREAFFFWRISKGAPGLPDEGGPGDSAMPAWEQFLTEEEMWEVILFLYDFNPGFQPRAVAEGH
jgi:mono/diheme cytochrome c family protein